MEIRILLFGPVAERAGMVETGLEVEEGARVEEALRALEARFEALRGALQGVAVAVNESYARPETVLAPGDVLAVIPPVSGG